MKKTKISLHTVMLTLITLALFACKEDKPTNDTIDTPKEVKVPNPDRDSAFYYVKRQVDFGPRVPGSEAHKKTADWISNQLEKFGAEVTLQTFDAEIHTGQKVTGVNIIGSYNPQAKKRILLAAHWDTRYIGDQDENPALQKKPIDGADDGGSGVGVLLEVARQLQANPLDLGVDIVFFDVEDQGKDSDVGNEDYTSTWCIGSQYWSKNPHTAGYTAKWGILLDMVGTKGHRFTKEGVSMTHAPNIMNRVWELAAAEGYAGYFVTAKTPGIIDDHYFVNEYTDIPMIDIINRTSAGTFGSYWHTHDDNIEVIDARALRRVAKVVLKSIYYEDAGQF